MPFSKKGSGVGGGGDRLTAEQWLALDSIVDLPDNAVPKGNNGTLVASVATSDEDLVVAASVKAEVGSYELGGAHKITSAGENVSFENIVSQVNYHPGWQTFADGNTLVSRVRTTQSEVTLSDKTSDLVDPVWDNGAGAVVDHSVRQVILDFVNPVTDLVVELDIDGVEFYKESFGAFATGEQTVLLNPPLDVRVGQLVTFRLTESAGGSITLKGSTVILDSMSRPTPFQKTIVATWVDEKVTTLFGTEFEMFESLPESTTTSTTFQDKLNVTTSTKPAGTYRVLFNCQVANSKKDKTVKVRMMIDGAETHAHAGDDIRYNAKENNQYMSVSILRYVVLASPATILLQTQFARQNDIAKISDATIEIWRVA